MGGGQYSIRPNTPGALRFFKITGKTFEEKLVEDFMIGLFMMLMPIIVSDCLYKSICCGYSFELPRQVEAIQMSTHNICFYKEVDTNTWAVT